MHYRSMHLDSHGHRSNTDNPSPNYDTTSLVPIGPSERLFYDPVLLPTPMDIP